jgi:hypothetical protein
MCAPFATPYQSASVFLAVLGTRNKPCKNPESYVRGTVALNSEFSLLLLSSSQHASGLYSGSVKEIKHLQV